MFNLEKFIADSVTYRSESMFAKDIEANKEALTREIKGKKVCVIGGAGSIGSSFIKAVGARCAFDVWALRAGGVPLLYAEFR